MVECGTAGLTIVQEEPHSSADANRLKAVDFDQQMDRKSLDGVQNTIIIHIHPKSYFMIDISLIPPDRVMQADGAQEENWRVLLGPSGPGTVWNSPPRSPIT